MKKAKQRANKENARLKRKNITIGALTVALLLTSGLTVASAADQDQKRHGPRFLKDTGVQEAISSGDYAAWQEIVEEKKLPEPLEALTQEQFEQFGQMIELRKAGDKEGASALREALGLPEKPERPDCKHPRHHVRPNIDDDDDQSRVSRLRFLQRGGAQQQAGEQA
jgi:hypothetical protein